MLEGDRLYGRGGADDGYAAFASLTAIEAVQTGGGSHARCVVLIEASEESGSPDLPAHVDALSDRIGSPSSSCASTRACQDYERHVGHHLAARPGRHRAHGRHRHRRNASGDVSGMVPSTFRIARSLLSRIEDETTGKVLLESCRLVIPPDRIERAWVTAAKSADRRPLPVRRRAGPDRRPTPPSSCSPRAPDTRPQRRRRRWPAANRQPGNVLRPRTALKLSLRIPPTADPGVVGVRAVVSVLFGRSLPVR